jgi:hypothetical protein
LNRIDDAWNSVQRQTLMDKVVNLWAQGRKLFEQLSDSACQELGWLAGWLIIQSVIWLNAINM